VQDGRLGGSSEDGNELEGASDGEVGVDLEDGVDREDDIKAIMGMGAASFSAQLS
jgi:hypothetical protein